MSGVTKPLQTIAQADWFSRFILLTILAAAVIVGIQTDERAVERYGTLLHLADQIILWIFVAEAAIKMGQYGKQWHRYFQDPWNIFDFTIVVVCFLPSDDAQFAAVLRLARILRALRLVTAIPRLQLLVSCLLKSIPSMAYVGVLLFLLFYVYAVMGVFLFRGNDPVHFGSLSASLLSLFRVVTLEDWTDVMYIQMFGSDTYPYPMNDTFIATDPKAMPLVGMFYFVSFVMIGTMIVLNLFIGVIINSMDEAQEEREKAEIIAARERGEGMTLTEEIDEIQEQFDKIKEHLHLLQLRIETRGNGQSSAPSDPPDA